MNELHLTVWFLRILATIGSGLLFYAAFFLFPDDRKEIQSRLENWWVKFDDLKQRSTSRTLLFLRRVAESTAKAFDWVFGATGSLKFFSVTCSLSIASLGIAFFALGRHRLDLFAALMFFMLASLGLIGSWDWPGPFRWTKFFKLSIVGFAVVFTVYVLIHVIQGESLVESPVSPKWWPLYMAAWLTSVLCDAGSIWVTRLVLRRLSSTTGMLEAGGLLALDAALVAAMVVIPLGIWYSLETQITFLDTYLHVTGWANLSTSLPSVVYLVTALVLLVHRFSWPILLRPFYNLVEAKVIEKRRALALLGIACLVAAWPGLLVQLGSPIVKAILGLF